MTSTPSATPSISGSPPASPASAACADHDPVRADVDGDGRIDFVWYDFLQGPLRGATLGVCTATGEVDRIRTSGMAELLSIVDVEPDGRDEIVFGGTSVSAQFEILAVYSDGLRPVLVRGTELVLTSGIPHAHEDHSWGCEDVHGDDRNEIVQMIVRDAPGVPWTRTAYRLDGFTAVEVSSESGELGGSFEPWIAASLTEDCPRERQ